MLSYVQNTRGKSKEYTVGFMGLNYSENTKPGEFSDMKNLSCRAYPVLTQREPRAVLTELEAPNALYARGQLAYVDGTGFYYRKDGEFVAKGAVADGPKQFATVNTKIVIWPDKLIYDTETDEMLPIDLTFRASAGSISFTSSVSACTIVSSGEEFGFRRGDAVKVSGCTSIPVNNLEGAVIIRGVSEDKKTLTFDPGQLTAGSEAGEVTISRESPDDIEFICSSNNRLWGCGGGKIYASALGDPFNFNVFDGLSTDSYAVAVGSDGAFTGCVGYGSMQVLFFKEHIVHKIVGTKPANYDMADGHFYGVMSGCHKSAVVINELLYYWSRQGLMAYSGGVPYSMSDNFGERRFRSAVAASDGRNYYVSMQDEAGGWGLYTFDTQKRLWMREDDTRAVDLAMFEGKVYFLNADGKLCINSGGDEDVEWSATLCPFNETMVETKHYSKFVLRAEIEDKGGYIDISVSHDGAPWRKIKTIKATGRRVFLVPIIPVRCDCFQIRLAGKGESKILTLTREYGAGSDRL